MKPPEILGMLEEAAGTRMYEQKKEAALKTLEKKQVKVEEIDKVGNVAAEPETRLSRPFAVHAWEPPDPRARTCSRLLRQLVPSRDGSAGSRPACTTCQPSTLVCCTWLSAQVPAGTTSTGPGAESGQSALYLLQERTKGVVGGPTRAEPPTNL